MQRKRAGLHVTWKWFKLRYLFAASREGFDARQQPGEVSEWLKEHAWKVCIR